MEPSDFEVKQYVDREVEHLRELRQADHTALQLQHAEYTRRLEELNHAHQKAEQDRLLFLTISTYEAAHREALALIEVQRQAAEKANNLAENNAKDIARLTSTLTWITRTVVGAILVAIVALLLRGTPMFPTVP